MKATALILGAACGIAAFRGCSVEVPRAVESQRHGAAELGSQRRVAIAGKACDRLVDHRVQESGDGRDHSVRGHFADTRSVSKV